MPSVTHDARSFLLDGRRIWIVSGTVPYSRLCRESWRDRIHAAKLAGLNAVETPVFWNRHEPRPGRFDFTGENDLRHFVELVQAAGLYCILRIGPYTGDGWDLGGLPSWLLEGKPLTLRSASGPFLEACSRFITAVADEIRDLQVTSPGKGGPIVLVQSENNWNCGVEHLATEYLGELNRYLREGGIAVPILSSNNLWQSVEGQIDVWSGSGDLLSTMRQLTAVRATQPRMVIDYGARRARVWGEEPEPQVNPWSFQRRLAEILAGGGQFNLRNFADGTNMGFWSGRLADGPASYVCAGPGDDTIVSDSGQPAPVFNAVRRICYFASRFGRVFANLEPTFLPVCIDPARHAAQPGAKKSKATEGANLSAIYAQGNQGSVAFIFGEDPEDNDGVVTPRSTTLLMPDGSTLPVTLGKQAVGWCLFNTHVNGRSQVDYCNFNAFASVGQVFVGFGPAGSRALLSVNDSPIEVTIPTGKSPLVVEHEGLTVVLVSEDEIDSTHVSDNAVFVGVAGVAADGHPLPSAEDRHYTRIDSDGKVKKMSAEAVKPAAHEKVSINGWSVAPMSDYHDGTSPRYANISGPADLTSLGCPYGYGWYRMTPKTPPGRKVHLAFPQSADRLHAYIDGQFVGVVGAGPGATQDIAIPFKKTPQRLVLLAENFGRFSEGAHLGERKGLYGPVWEHEPLKLGKVKIVRGAPVEILNFRTPLWEVREGDSTLPDRITWTLTTKRKTPLIIWFTRFPGRALLLLNDEPVSYIDSAGPSSIILDPEKLSKATTTIQIAIFGDAAGETSLDAAADSISFSDAVAPFSEKSEFAFAKWEPPSATMYAPASKTGARLNACAWWKCTFKLGASRTPLYLEPNGMTKGQIYVNGHHLSRYFVATAEGKDVPPQSRYLLPDAWLRHGRENELVLFDEHGAHPGKVHLAYEHEGTSVIRA